MNKERESESAGEPEPQPGHLDTASLVRQESYTSPTRAELCGPADLEPPPSH